MFALFSKNGPRKSKVAIRETRNIRFDGKIRRQPTSFDNSHTFCNWPPVPHTLLSTPSTATRTLPAICSADRKHA
jgi:hypothetical protein